jgi:UDPglucose 6-dehydrogenase
VRVSVVGLGHVGLTTAACLASVGHDVVGVDDDPDRARLIAGGDAPFFEPDLPELLRAGLGSGRLRIAEGAAEAAGHGEVAFICVGTPIRDDGSPNLTQVERAAAALAAGLRRYAVLTEKSTVPVGTGTWIRRTAERRAPRAELDVASNPEFLREGTAVADTLRPTRIVVGAASGRAHATLRAVFDPILSSSGCPFIATTIESAEIIKLASNAFLATKVSFVNAVADVCEAAGADVETVAAAMGLDPRIGPQFLRAGIGYGGYCLPKDIAAFRHKGAELGVDLALLEEVARVNRSRRGRVLAKVRDLVWNLEGKRIAVWGLSFKGGTDDVRESPAIGLVAALVAAGAEVATFDPAVDQSAGPLVPGSVAAADPHAAARGAAAVVVATDWPEFRQVDLPRLASVMQEPVIVDARNLLDARAVRDAGFTYAAMGRPTLHPTPERGRKTA